MKLFIVLLVSILLFSGCSEHLVRVLPFEKEYFAQDKMSLSPLAERSEQDSHIFLIREASAGGDSAFQGGCGCR